MNGRRREGLRIVRRLNWTTGVEWEQLRVGGKALEELRAECAAVLARCRVEDADGRDLLAFVRDAPA
ncbi:hypothetical protein EVG20_g10206 [Dentipellis fragilis]|uniref:Uncharacterized protein n=1 Tax=Dentipellis fragilis TaxID=205917 RepID=A0A4Y9XUZ1_9AGAM|nr:hypothetical protein EVG20_g10206 [Dentipellis fragilis]